MSQLVASMAALQRFARLAEVPGDRCELCGCALPSEHGHLFDARRRALCCACADCALRMAQGDSPWVRVPTRVVALFGLTIGPAMWRALGVPVELAFVRRVADGSLVAAYPSPGGATESPVRQGAFRDLETLHVGLASMTADVEALLANRLGGSEAYYRVPIDECYRLVALVRARFRGMDGGRALRADLEAFFAGLDARAEVSLA
jgi:hypothetical protein